MYSYKIPWSKNDVCIFLLLFILSKLLIRFLSAMIHPILMPGNKIFERLPIYIVEFPSPHMADIGAICVPECCSSSLKPSSIIGILFSFIILYNSVLFLKDITIPVGRSEE